MTVHTSFRFVRIVASAAAIAAASSTIGVGQQVPQPAVRPAQPAPRDPGGERQVVIGKGTISGAVVVAGTGQPARRARVNLSGGNEVGGNRSATTDDMGRFAFSALPEGRFNLSASKPGHINATYGQRQPGRPGTPIQLADGQRLDVQLQMTRGGVITGTVLDEYGEAIPNTPVRALRYVMQSGQRTLQQSGNSQTDDRGMYRIYGLQPGEYLVYATPRNTSQGVDAARQAELQALMARSDAAQRFEGGGAQAQAIAERIAQLRQSADGSEETSSGYAPVYYPGTTAPSSAIAITVGAGEEKGGIDFQYQVVPVARVEGIVTTTSSQVPSNIQISLVNSGAAVPGVSPGNARADAQGNFRIQNVPPGQYTVIARATLGAPGREGGPGGRGFAPPGGRGEGPVGRGRAGMPGPAGADPIRLWAMSEVTVDGRSVANVALTLQPGMSVSGRIAFDGAAPQPTDLTRMRVTLASYAPPGVSGEIAQTVAGRIDADGRFTVSSVLPGKYRLSASGAGNGWYPGVVHRRRTRRAGCPARSEAESEHCQCGRDVRRPNVGADRHDRQRALAADARVYADRLSGGRAVYWAPQSRRIQSTRPATDGRFSFRSLPAGDYRIVPVYDPEPGSWYDPAFLEQLEPASVRVSIADGEKKEQHLRIPGGG